MRRARNCTLALAASVLSLFAAAGAAQGVVVDMNAAGRTTVPFNAADQTGYYGLALAGNSRSYLALSGVPTVIPSGPCTDPALSSDLLLPSTGLCSQGGPVMHSNESFALTWDPTRSYWQTTRNYVEQYLSDVASASGTLTSPYAVVSQYTDSGGRAQNASAFGGGCIDYGNPGGYTCQFGDTSGAGTGNNYPTNGCPVSGTNAFNETLGGYYVNAPNTVCLTDAQVRSEVASVVAQSGMLSYTRAGYTPLIVVLTPPGVETCLDAAGTVCSGNGAASVAYCSYHAQVNVGGTQVAYMVQPWVAVWGTPDTGCVDASAPVIPSGSVDAQTLATDVGAQLVSPLSQAQIASIVDPGLNGWISLAGSEINDNGCVPLPQGLDTATLAGGSYTLQREFNNAGVIQTDPNSPSCAGNVNLVPKFVVPTSVEKGDVVELDGSTTISSLIVPKANYSWSFGDGSTAVGPSVVHTYAAAGNFAVKLTVTDRGGNTASLSQTITVLGPQGQNPNPNPTPNPSGSALRAHVQLLPQGLKGLLRHGISLRVTANQAADGFVTLSIPSRAARRAHIHGHGSWVVIGRGTVAGVSAGTVSLRVHLSRAMVKKLEHLRHVTVSVRMTLTAVGGAHVAVDVAGRY